MGLIEPCGSRWSAASKRIQAGKRAVWSACVRGLIETFGVRRRPTPECASTAPSYPEHVSAPVSRTPRPSGRVGDLGEISSGWKNRGSNVRAISSEVGCELMKKDINTVVSRFRSNSASALAWSYGDSYLALNSRRLQQQVLGPASSTHPVSFSW